MTRKTIYRLTLAMLMLPNFAAYWWLLPRRFKVIRTQAQLMRYLEYQLVMKWLSSEFERMDRTWAAINSGTAWPIEAKAFRLPFQINRG